MGVKGLLSYITNNGVLQEIELSLLAKKIRHKTEKAPKLLCDFMNLVPCFIIPPVMKLISCGHYPWYAQVTGADFHLIAERACNFVAALKHLGVEPVFFIDGARGTDKSFEGKIHVLKDREARKLQEIFRLQQVCEHMVDKAISMYLPCNAVRQIEKSLKKVGAEIVYCNGEADPEIIHYAQSHDEVCGVLSNDSDFAITNGCVMFPIEKFDVNNNLGLLKDVQVDEKPREVVCQVIYPSSLADSLGIRENQLPDLAVLCGTDYTHHLNKRLSVLTRLGVKGEHVKSIAEWLKDKEMPLLQYQPMRELCIEHPEMRVAVEQSYSNYTFEVPQSPPAAVNFASPLYHIIEKEARSGKNNILLPVAKKGILWRTMIKENLTLGQPCLSSLLLPLRWVMYILLGVKEVQEYGRSQMQAYDEVVVPVCTKPEEVELGIQCFHSLRELEQSGRLIGMYRLVNKSLHVKCISDVKRVVNGVVRGSQKLPNLYMLAQSTMLCSCLKLIACLNKVSQPPLGLTDSELDAILITCLTCATDGQIMPHIVNVMPSMRTFTVSEWFALILMHCYRVASLVGVASCPEPKQMFYQMAFVPYHLSLESRDDLTTKQKSEINYIQNAMKTILTLPKVETFRASIFNPGELQPLSLLVALFGAALDEVKKTAGEWLPCVMAMDYKDVVKDLVKDLVKEETLYSRIDPETGFGNYTPSHQDAQLRSLEGTIDRAVAVHFYHTPSSPTKESLSSMTLSARQSVLKDHIWDRKELPIMEHKGKILNLIFYHQVMCIEGETGCGKSSQVPQFILEDSLETSEQCKILASQPNLLTARKLAQRVSTERHEPLNKTVGYCDELDGVEQQLTFVTTGYMLKALLNCQTECSYTHIILDEIHERSTEIDFALFIARKLAVTFPDLKIILVSATLQGSLFIEYFRKELGHDKVADPYFVGIKRFPVKVVFIDQLDELVSPRKDKTQRAAVNHLQLLARQLENNTAERLPFAPEVTPFTEEVCANLIISQLSPGEAVLIFHSGLGDINEFCNNLHDKLRRLEVRDKYRLFIFHPQVESEDQDEAFLEPLEGTANIIVANRGSESSLTIPYLCLVINFGINKEMIYNSAKRCSELSRQWCSRASCIQREGRVGRVCEGTAVHLFTKEFYETLPDFGPPEIIRVPLAKTVLRAKDIGLQLNIPLPSHLLSMVIEPPSFVQFSTALHDLAEYGAIAHGPQQKISEDADVTLFGKFSLPLPLDLNLCRLVLLGILFGCPLDGIVIAAASAMYQDVFSMPIKVLMNDLLRFCHSLTDSTFNRVKYDDGCYSNPIMVRNMFIEWLQYKSKYPEYNCRDLAFMFGTYNAVKCARLLHFEELVGDIARCVVNCIPDDTALYSELQTLSHISTRFPEICESDFFLYKASPSLEQDGSTELLHFCNNCVILKALIAAAAPDDIVCGERACESSSPNSRTFAQKCINVIKKESFSLSHTLCMDLSKLKKEKIDEAVLEELFENFPSDFDLTVETKVVRDIAVLHFRPDPLSTLTKTAKSLPRSKSKYSTAEISQVPLEIYFFWQFGEQNLLWKIDELDVLFPAPSHPCALMWYKFDESKSKVNTVNLNFRNPTGFVCQYDKPSQPYFAVATGAFASTGGSILAPRLTVLPNMPTSLMMVLAFQLPTSTVEFLINKKNKTVKAIKINLVEIPCTDIEKFISSDEISTINEVRKAISNAMALSLNNGCIPLRNPAITRIPKLLHDLLGSCKPSISKSMTSNLQTLPMDDRLEELVWEMVTPGISIEDCSTSYYGEFRCSLVGTKPYDVKEVSHDQEPPQTTFSIEYTQSVSAKLLAESKRIQMKHALNRLLAENTKWKSLVRDKKNRKVKLQRDTKAVLSKKKVEREMKGRRKERKRTGKRVVYRFCPHSPSSPFILEAVLEEMVQSMDEAYLKEEYKIREKLERKREKKEKRKAEKKALLKQKEKLMGVKEATLRRKEEEKTEKEKKIKRKPENKLPLSFSLLFSSSPSPLSSSPSSSPFTLSPLSSPLTLSPLSSPLPLSPLSSPLTLSPLSSFPPAPPLPFSLGLSLSHPLSPSSKVPFSLDGDERFLHDQEWIVLSEYCSELSQKQDQDAQAANTLKEKRPTQSDTTGLEKSKGQTKLVLSVSQTVTNNNDGEKTVSKPPTTATLLEEKGKTCLTTAERNLSACGERGKTCLVAQTKSEMSKSSETTTETANRCQPEVEVYKVSQTKGPSKETPDSSSIKQKAANKVALNASQHSTGEHMAQFYDGFNSECGEQSRLSNEASLKETGEVKRAPFSEVRVEREKIQKERQVVLSKEKVEREKKAAQKERKKKIDAAISEPMVMSENEYAIKENEEKRKAAVNELEGVERKKKQEDNEMKKKKAEVGLPTSNSEQDILATSGIAEPDTWEESQIRSVLSVSQFVPANNQPWNATKSTKFHENKEKGSFTAAMSISTEKNKTSPETQTKTEMSENGCMESMTGMAPRCQTEIEVLKGTHTKKSLKETSVSDITPAKQKATSKVDPNGISAQCNVGEHIAQFSFGFINECGGETRLATPREEAPLREKYIVQKERKTAIAEERIKTAKKITPEEKEVREATFGEKETVKEIATKEKEERPALSDKEEEKIKKEEDGLKEREVALCKKKREEREKHATLNESKNVKTEEVEVKEEDERREKKEAKRGGKKKEASLVATNSDQKPPAHSGIAEPKERSVVSVSQTVPTTGNGKKTVSKSLTAPLGAIVCADEGKGSLTVPTGHHERKKTGPETMSENGSTKSTTRTSRSKIEPLKVTQTKKQAKEIAVSDGSPIMQKSASSASRVASKRIKAQPGTGEHMAQFHDGFNSKCGEQSRLRKDAFLKETGKVQKAPFSEVRVETEKIQKEREVVLSKEKVEREKNVEKVMSENEYAVKENKEKRKAAMNELEGVESKKKQEYNEMKKEREVALCEKEKEKEKQTTLGVNENLSREEEALREENIMREKRKKRRKKKIEVALATSKSEQNPPTKFGIGAPETCDESQLRLGLPGPQFLPTNDQPQTGTTGTKFLGDKEKESLTAAMSNPKNKTSPKTLTKTEMSENDCIESMTGMTPRCQTEIKVLKGTHTKKPLKETSVSDITPTKQKATSKVDPNAQYNVGEHMTQFSLCLTDGCRAQTRSATLREEPSLREKDTVQNERKTAITKKRVEAEKKIALKEKEVREADLSEKATKKVIATKEKVEERAALSDKEREKRKKGKESDAIQMERKVALGKKEREEREKHAALRESKNVKTEEVEVKEEDEKKEKKEAKWGKVMNERKKKEASLVATNTDQEPPAHSGIAEPKGRSVVSVSQTGPTTGNGKKAFSKSLTAPIGTNVCADEGKRSLTVPTGHHERKKTGPETMSGNGSTKSTTKTSRSKIQPMKVTSDITRTEQKEASMVVPNGTFAQYNMDEHMAQFSLCLIGECRGQTRSATLREEPSLREKDTVQNERERTMTEERIDAETKISLKEKEVREADLSEKATGKVIATKEKVEERAALSDKEREKRKKGKESDAIQNEREVALSKKEREEREKSATLKKSTYVKTEEVEVKDENEKRMAKRRKEKDEREKKEASLVATNSDQNPPAHSGIAEPKGRSVVSTSQTVPTTGNSKKTVSKSLTAPLGTNVCADEGKRSLTVPTGHHEMKKTGPETMSENGSTKSTTRTSRSKIEPLKVTQTKKQAKETVISDGPPIMQNAASRAASKRIPAQPGTSEHMAQFLVDFINECGGQTRLGALRRVAFRQYQEKYYGQYTYLSKGFFRQYDCFKVFEDSSGFCHVRVVGAQRRSLAHTEPEKMEHKTKKSLSCKSVCDIKMTNSSEDTRALEGNLHSVPGSPEHIVQYFYNYLSTHFFPYGCPVSSLDALYQKEYKSKFSHSQVEMINTDFLKAFSNRFVLQDGRMFVKLKEGVDHSDTSQLKGCPYTLQHVNDYFRRYLAQEGVVCTKQLQVLFSECYMKEFKMPQKPIIQFIQEDFFKRSGHLFVTFVDIVVFRK